jgi:hypothetical protein
MQGGDDKKGEKRESLRGEEGDPFLENGGGNQLCRSSRNKQHSKDQGKRRKRRAIERTEPREKREKRKGDRRGKKEERTGFVENKDDALVRVFRLGNKRKGGEKGGEGREKDRKTIIRKREKGEGREEREREGLLVAITFFRVPHSGNPEDSCSQPAKHANTYKQK